MSRPALLALLGLLAACTHMRPGRGPADALSPQEHVRLGGLYESQGLGAEARGEYLAAVRREPAFAPGWLALGNIAYVERRFKEAERRFRRVLRLSPRHPGASNNLAMTLLARNGSLPEAEALAQGVLERAGALRPYVLDTLANIYLRQRRYDEAGAAVEQALAEAPSDAGPVREQLRATSGSIQAAADKVEKAVK